MDWMLMPLRRYAEFSGRSRRMEYWMFTLLGIIVAVIAYALMLGGGAAALLTAAAVDPMAASDPTMADVSFGPLFWIGVIILVVWGLGTLIPSIAVTVRRLHDRNMSGWYLIGFIVVVFVLSLIPGIGTILVLLLEIGFIVLMALPGTTGPNQYGPDPLGQADPETFA
jgi:uncharacterized membrane protein YhaH (DUF805 family)